MKLMKLTLAAVAGGFLANQLLKKAGTSSRGAADQAGADAGSSAGAPAAARPRVSAGSGRSSPSPTAATGTDVLAQPSASSGAGTGSQSLNDAERLLAARPDDSLVGRRNGSLDPLGSNSRDGELATSTGLSDFSRGA